MSSPRIFISSTYNDLVDTRNEISEFVKNYAFDPVTFERNDVPFEPNHLIEDSCYEEIKTCSMLVLMIKRNFGSKTKRSHVGVSHSVTQNEYDFAREAGIPIFVFIHQNSLDEYNSFITQGKPRSFRFAVLENIDLAYFIESIHNDRSHRYIFPYSNVQDIKSTLKKQWAGLFNKYLTNIKKYSNEKIYINPFKLFYFRRSRGISRKKLGEMSGIDLTKIGKMEKAGVLKSHIEVEDFEPTTLEKAQKIAEALQCSVGNIKGGLPDDFLTQYLAYYFRNKGTKQRIKRHNRSLSLFKSKIVLFDFDGTLTKTNTNLTNHYTTWEEIWLYLKYDVNECAEIHRKYNNFEITHREWCKITEDKFKAKNLSITDMDKIASRMQLIEGTKEVIEKLASHNIKMYLVSGSINYIIKKVLGELYRYFDTVKSNEFVFDDKGFLKSIIGTKYDFEGKKDFISQAIKKNQINAVEAFFVGNSLNDEWAHESGAQTLCVNPSMTNPNDPIQWAYSIRNMNNLNEIFKYLNI